MSAVAIADMLESRVGDVNGQVAGAKLVSVKLAGVGDFLGVRDRMSKLRERGILTWARYP